MKKAIIIITSVAAVIAIIIYFAFFFVTPQEREMINAVVENSKVITQTGTDKCKLLRNRSDYYLECFGDESGIHNIYYEIKDGTLKFYESGSGFFDTKEHCLKSDAVKYSENMTDQQLEEALSGAIKQLRYSPYF